jgi:hypothetical protein
MRKPPRKMDEAEIELGRGPCRLHRSNHKPTLLDDSCPNDFQPRYFRIILVMK